MSPKVGIERDLVEEARERRVLRLAVEEGEVVLQIASVGLGRARRCPALDAQMGQVLVQGVL